MALEVGHERAWGAVAPVRYPSQKALAEPLTIVAKQVEKRDKDG
ncbi:hypothetical protein [Streptomyces violaceusniger]